MKLSKKNKQAEEEKKQKLIESVKADFLKRQEERKGSAGGFCARSADDGKACPSHCQANRSDSFDHLFISLCTPFLLGHEKNCFFCKKTKKTVHKKQGQIFEFNLVSLLNLNYYLHYCDIYIMNCAFLHGIESFFQHKKKSRKNKFITEQKDAQALALQAS